MAKTLEDKFAGLRVWKNRGQRAPHKPLLVLYALGRVLLCKPRLVPFFEAEKYVKPLLEEFGPVRSQYRIDYPFNYLKNDGLWELEGPYNLADYTGRKKLIQRNVRGGFTREIYFALKADKKLALKLALIVSEAHFPRSLQSDILKSVGIDHSLYNLEERDLAFKEKILSAYGHNCAVCGLDLRLKDASILLEAAHIKWIQAGGPNKENNGLALCCMHHRLFDRGAFTVSGDFKIRVSGLASGNYGFNDWLMRFHKKPIKTPQKLHFYPDPNYLSWHQSEVFKRPARD